MKQQGLTAIGILILSVLLYAGGPPNKGTPADRRLKEHRPDNKRPKSAKPAKVINISKKGKK